MECRKTYLFDFFEIHNPEKNYIPKGLRLQNISKAKTLTAISDKTSDSKLALKAHLHLPCIITVQNHISSKTHECAQADAQ